MQVLGHQRYFCFSTCLLSALLLSYFTALLLTLLLLLLLRLLLLLQLLLLLHYSYYDDDDDYYYYYYSSYCYCYLLFSMACVRRSWLRQEPGARQQPRSVGFSGLRTCSTKLLEWVYRTTSEQEAS